MKRILSLILAISSLISCFAFTANAETVKVADKFKDLKDGAWYIEGIQGMYDRGLMTGVSDNKYSPSAYISHGMIMSILYRLSGEKASYREGVWDDVNPNHWYAECAIWAHDSKMTDVIPSIYRPSTYNEFRANACINRQELCVLLYHFAGTPQTRYSINHFADAGNVYRYAVNAVRWCVENGIVAGKDNGILDPLAYTTRAEVARMLNLFIEVYETDDKYIVTYMSDGNEYTHISYPLGRPIGKTPYIYKSDHELLGWFYNDGKKEVMLTETFTFTEPGEYTVYAKWVPVYRVYFIPNALSLEPIFGDPIALGEPLGELPEVSLSGYRFEGWYHKNVKVTEDTAFTIYDIGQFDTNTIYVYAKWTKVFN